MKIAITSFALYFVLWLRKIEAKNWIRWLLLNLQDNELHSTSCRAITPQCNFLSDNVGALPLDLPAVPGTFQKTLPHTKEEKTLHLANGSFSN